MAGIDWNRYAQISESLAAPALERFAHDLRQAAVVATNQSIPVYEGRMRGCLVTILRQMTDLLKRCAEKQLTGQDLGKIRWKEVEERMREVFFGRLSRIGNMRIAEEYVRTRIQNKPSDRTQMYLWAESLQNDAEEIERIIRRTEEETGAFAREDVPCIMEMACLGIRMRHQS